MVHVCNQHSLVAVNNFFSFVFDCQEISLSLSGKGAVLFHDMFTNKHV